MDYRYVFATSFSISSNISFVNKVWGFTWYNEKSAMAHIKALSFIRDIK